MGPLSRSGLTTSASWVVFTVSALHGLRSFPVLALLGTAVLGACLALVPPVLGVACSSVFGALHVFLVVIGLSVWVVLGGISASLQVFLFLYAL